MSDVDEFVGLAAGVPVIVRPPADGRRPDAPIVLAWHLQDPPRTESALAAALALEGLDAWRIYLGLPLSGSRLPEGGFDEVMRLGYDDAVMNLQGPVVDQAAKEVGPALAQLRDRFDLGTGAIGVLGGSIGAAVAMLVMADGVLPVETSVLVSPLVRLEAAVESLGRQYGITYPWSPESRAVAARLDFVARTADFSAHGDPTMLLIVGADDDPSGFLEPARQLADARNPRRVELVTIDGMGHAFADEPGDEPAPPTAAAKRIDTLATDWFDRRLTERTATRG
jgi:dienelactone hydrolase